ncbi:hypothetical protein AAVH_37611 [Aphelenchoides avenae]|nr:hypothetical protein AAVH_37611 [Aphelenchus avenae]
MPANLRALFREPSDIAAEFQKNFTTVTAFQKEQRKRMQKLAQSNRKRQMEEPSNATNRDLKRAQNNEAELQAAMAEIDALRRENNRLKHDATHSANARCRRAVSPTPTSGSYTRARARTSTSTRSRSMPRARSVVEENEGFFNGLDSLGNSMLTSSSSFDVPKTPLWR